MLELIGIGLIFYWFGYKVAVIAAIFTFTNGMYHLKDRG